MATVLFYVLATAALLATLLCITRRNPVHAVIFLVKALFALALLYYLLGAPLVAAWQIIIYAGAIMVLFLFVIMMLELGPAGRAREETLRQLVPAVLLVLVLLGSAGLIILQDSAGAAGVPRYHLTPREFGQALFSRYGLAVDIISFQLLFAVAGAWHLGRRRRREKSEQ